MTTEDGQLLNAYTVTIGAALAADATAGDTTVTLDDAIDFNPDGGSLLIGGQTVTYTAVDDDTNVVALGSALSADASAGDRVDVWDTGLGEVATETRALVTLPLSLANDDPIDAVVAHSLVPLVELGIRDPGTGESVTMTERGDEWTVIDVRGRQAVIQPAYGKIVTGDSSGDVSTSITSTVTGAGSSVASGVDAVAIGDTAEATADYTVAIGSGPVANATNATAIGNNAHATADSATGLGAGAHATALEAVAVGNAAAAADYSVAIGNSAGTGAAGAVAIGADHTGAGASSVVIDEIRLGTANHITVIEGKLVAADGSGGLHQIVVSAGGVLSTVAYP